MSLCTFTEVSFVCLFGSDDLLGTFYVMYQVVGENFTTEYSVVTYPYADKNKNTSRMEIVTQSSA